MAPTYTSAAHTLSDFFQASNKRPRPPCSALSKYGVYSFPLFFIYSKNNRAKFTGKRKLEILVEMITTTTGKVNALNEVVTTESFVLDALLKC
jgi:hypothetical protein